jgi:polysaccharide biosynthesis protein VpsQ
MKSTARIVVAGLFILFFCVVVYWADTGTMPRVLQSVYHFPYGDRVGHFVLYGLLTGLLTWAFPDCRIGTRIPLGLFIAGFVAFAEETSQLLIVTRTADWVDLGCGVLGILMAHMLCRKFIAR